MRLLCVVPPLQLVKAANKAGSQEQQQLPVSVRAQLALLSQQWPVAEALLLAQGQVDETIALYQQAHRCVIHHTCSDCIRAAWLVVNTTQHTRHLLPMHWILCSTPGFLVSAGGMTQSGLLTHPGTHKRSS